MENKFFIVEGKFMTRLMLNDAFDSNFSCGGTFLMGKREFATLQGVK